MTEGSGRRDTLDQMVAEGPDLLAGASWALAGSGTSKPTAILRGLPVAMRRWGWGALTTQPHGWEGSQEDTPLCPSKQGFLHYKMRDPGLLAHKPVQSPLPIFLLGTRKGRKRKKARKE